MVAPVATTHRMDFRAGFNPACGCCDCCTTRIGIALQPLQIRANIGGVLVAQLPVFLQRLVDDFFELWGKVGIQPHWRQLALRFRIASAITPEVSPRKGRTPVAIS